MIYINKIKDSIVSLIIFKAISIKITIIIFVIFVNALCFKCFIQITTAYHYFLYQNFIITNFKNSNIKKIRDVNY